MTTLRRAHSGDLEPFRAFVAGLSPTIVLPALLHRGLPAPHLVRDPAVAIGRHRRSLARLGRRRGRRTRVLGRHGAGTAELALVVADNAQGRGLGRALTSAALRDATAAGDTPAGARRPAGQPSRPRPHRLADGRTGIPRCATVCSSRSDAPTAARRHVGAAAADPTVPPNERSIHGTGAGSSRPSRGADPRSTRSLPRREPDEPAGEIAADGDDVVGCGAQHGRGRRSVSAAFAISS